MLMAYNIYKRSGGIFDVFQNGKLLFKSIPDETRLRQCLAPYHIVDDRYRFVAERLRWKRKATVKIPLVRKISVLWPDA